MAYKPEHPVLNDSGEGSLVEFTKRQEGRIEREFSSIDNKISKIESKASTGRWTIYNDNIEYRVKDDIVLLRGGSFGRYQLKNGTFTTIGNLFDDLRPNRQLYFPITVFEDDHNGAFMRIEVDGKVNVFMKDRPSSYWGFTVMYFRK